MPKMKVMNFRMSIDPKVSSEANLDIFDDIGEYYFFGEKEGIGPKTVSDFLNENTGIERINVRINSNGGDVFDGIAIYNLLKNSGKEVNVEIVGIAASAASLVAMAGNVTMHPASQMMIHKCWTFCMGNADKLRKVATQMDKVMESSEVIYLEKAGNKLTKEELAKLLDDETYLTAQECLNYGLCDSIQGQEPKEEPKTEAPKVEELNQPNYQQTSIEPIQQEVNWFF